MYPEDFDPDLMLALESQESNGNPRAISPVGARGAFQIMPATWDKFADEGDDPWDRDTSEKVARRVLADEYKRFKDPKLALAAYNAGAGRVQQAMDRALKAGVPLDFDSMAAAGLFRKGDGTPLEETVKYVPEVLSKYAAIKRQRGEDITQNSAAYRRAGDIGSKQEFVEELKGLTTSKGFYDLPAEEAVNRIDQIYKSRAWATEADDAYKDVAEALWNGDPEASRPDPYPMVAPYLTNIQGKNDKEIDESAKSTYWQIKDILKKKGVNPAMFGNALDEIVARKAQKEKMDNKGIIGTATTWAGIMGNAAINSAIGSPLSGAAEIMGLDEWADYFNTIGQETGNNDDQIYELDENGRVLYGEDKQPLTKTRAKALQFVGNTVGSIAGFAGISLAAASLAPAAPVAGTVAGAAALALRAQKIKTAFSLFGGAAYNVLSAAGEVGQTMDREMPNATYSEKMAGVLTSIPFNVLETITDAYTIGSGELFLKGLSKARKVKRIAQMAAVKAPAEGFAEATQQLGVELGVKVGTGGQHEISGENIAYSAGAGALVGGVLGGFQGAMLKPRPETEEPKPVKIAGYLEQGKSRAINAAPPIDEATQIQIAKKVEEFHDSHNQSLILNFPNVEDIPQGLKDVFPGLDFARNADGTITVMKKSSGEAIEAQPIPTNIPEIDADIVRTTEEAAKLRDSIPEDETTTTKNIVAENLSKLSKKVDQMAIEAIDTRPDLNGTAKEFREEAERLAENQSKIEADIVYKQNRLKKANKDTKPLLRNDIGALKKKLDIVKEERKAQGKISTVMDQLLATRRKFQILNNGPEKTDPTLYRVQALENRLGKLSEAKQKALSEGELPYKPEDYSITFTVGEGKLQRKVIHSDGKWYALNDQGKVLGVGQPNPAAAVKNSLPDDVTMAKWEARNQILKERIPALEKRNQELQAEKQQLEGMLNKPKLKKKFERTVRGRLGMIDALVKENNETIKTLREAAEKESPRTMRPTEMPLVNVDPRQKAAALKQIIDTADNEINRYTSFLKEAERRGDKRADKMRKHIDLWREEKFKAEQELKGLGTPTKPTKPTKTRGMSLGQMLRKGAETEGEELGAEVWHGGRKWDKEPGFPFGRFKLEFAGTGAGNSEGPGMYVAQVRAVSERYKRYVDEDITFKAKGKEYMPSYRSAKNSSNEELAANRVFNSIFDYDKDSEFTEDVLRKGLDKALDDSEHDIAVHRRAISSKYATPETIKWDQSLLDEEIAIRDILLDWKNNGIEVSKKAVLYKLDLPDEVIPKLFAWDEYLGHPDNAKLYEAIQELYNEAKKTSTFDDEKWKWKELIDFDDGKPYTRDVTGGEAFLYLSDNADRGPIEVAELLKSKGIPGHKYLDAQSRSAGEGTYNLVIWDQDILDRTYPVEIDGEPTGLTKYPVEEDEELSSFVGRKGALNLYIDGGEKYKKIYEELARARQLEDAGIDKKEIFKQTGWFRWPGDRQWRYEISDANFTVTGYKHSLGTTKKAQDLIRHQDILAAYPAISNSTKITITEPDDASSGVTYKDSGIIYIEANYPYKPYKEGEWRLIAENARKPAASEVNKTVIHELQHVIQLLEEHNRGGSSADYITSSKYLDSLSYIKDMVSSNNELSLDAAYNFYRLLPGEIEARLTSARRNLTTEERRNQYPLDSLSKKELEALQLVEERLIELEKKAQRVEEDTELSSSVDLDDDFLSAGFTPQGRIKVNPIPNTGENISTITGMINKLQKLTGKTINITKFQKRGDLGKFGPRFKQIMVRYAGDIPTAIHESAHALDNRYGVSEFANRLASGNQVELDNELYILGESGSKSKSKDPAVQREYQLKEGVAEGILSWMIDPDYVEAQFPNFTKQFRKLFPEDLLLGLRDLGDDVRRFYGAPEAVQIRTSIPGTPEYLENSLSKTVNDAAKKVDFFVNGDPNNVNRVKEKGWMEFIDKWADPEYYLRQATRILNKAAGIKEEDVKYEDSPEMLLAKTRGHAAMVQLLATKGVPDPYHKRKFVTEGLITITNKHLKKDTAEKMYQEKQDFYAKMLAEHTLELELQRRQNIANKAAGLPPIRPKLSDYGPITGIAGTSNFERVDRTEVEVATKALKNFDGWSNDKKRRYDAFQKDVRGFARAAIEYGQKVGRFSKDMHLDDFYYPLMRNLAEEKDGLFSLEGSGRELKENTEFVLLHNASLAIKIADKNRVKGAFVNLLRKATENNKMFSGEDISDIGYQTTASRASKDAIVYYDQGRATYWEIKGPERKALQDYQDAVPDNVLINAFGFFSNLLKKGVTATPGYAAFNYTKDIFGRFINSDLPILTQAKYTAIMTKQLSGEGVKAIIKGIGLENTALGQYAEKTLGFDLDVDAIKIAGGDQAGLYVQSEADIYKAFRTALKEASTDKNSILWMPARVAGRAWDSYTDFLGKVELAGRLAEYKGQYEALKKKGLTDAQASGIAAAKARGLMDFAVIAHNMKTIEKVLPYTNVRVRGLARMIKTATERPGDFLVRQLIFSALPVLLVRHWNKSQGAEDEYEQRPNYMNDMFNSFKIGDNAWINVPVGSEGVFIHAFADRMYSYLMNGNKEAFKGYVGNVIYEMSPVAGVPLTALGKPQLEAIVNYDMFRERNIVPYYDVKKSLGEREPSKGASRFGNLVQKVVGNTVIGETRIGKALFSAQGWDHQVRGMFGNAGSLMLQATDYGREVGGKPLTWATVFRAKSETPVYGTKDVEFVMSYATNYGISTQNRKLRVLQTSINKYFEAVDPADKQAAADRVREVAARLKAGIDAKGAAYFGQKKKKRKTS